MRRRSVIDFPTLRERAKEWSSSHTHTHARTPSLEYLQFEKNACTMGGRRGKSSNSFISLIHTCLQPQYKHKEKPPANTRAGERSPCTAPFPLPQNTDWPCSSSAECKACRRRSRSSAVWRSLAQVRSGHSDTPSGSPWFCVPWWRYNR